MKIFFPDATVFGDASSFDDLLRIFLCWRSAQHEVVLADAEAFLGSAFFAEGLPAHHRAEHQETARRLATERDARERTADPSAAPTEHHAEICRTPREVAPPLLWSLTPERGAAWAVQPLTLLLENHSDGALVRGAAVIYDRERLWDALEMGWCRLDGRGGCGEVLNSVRRAGAEDRLFVLVDSDRTSSGAESGATQRRIQEACQWHRSPTPRDRRGAPRCPAIPSHVLQKREAENYLPGALLDEVTLRPNPDRRSAFRNWRRLTEEEKDTDDLKARFSEPQTNRALEFFREGRHFTSADLDERAGDELRVLTQQIEAYL